jgi:hypothetical protein
MAKKDKAVDPFMITEEDVADAKSAVSAGSSGILCPKRNKDIGNKCSVCDYIQTQIYSKKFDKDHAAMTWARQKKAKLTWFLNVVLPENPDKSVFLELGDKAGNQIIEGVDKKGWTDIVHPHKGVGRELLCSKTKNAGESWPTYTVSPVLKNADWEIPEKVWKNVPNLRDMLQILDTEELTEDNYMHIRSLKEGETLTFRVCPPRDAEVGKKKWFIAPVFRHWGVTEEQITGEETLNWKEDSDDEDKEVVDPSEGKLDLSFTDTGKKDKSEVKPEKEEKPKEAKTKKPCFGKSNFFEEDDVENCKPCPDYKACAKACM